MKKLAPMKGKEKCRKPHNYKRSINELKFVYLISKKKPQNCQGKIGILSIGIGIREASLKILNPNSSELFPKIAEKFIFPCYKSEHKK